MLVLLSPSAAAAAVVLVASTVSKKVNENDDEKFKNKIKSFVPIFFEVKARSGYGEIPTSKQTEKKISKCGWAQLVFSFGAGMIVNN